MKTENIERCINGVEADLWIRVSNLAMDELVAIKVRLAEMETAGAWVTLEQLKILEWSSAECSEMAFPPRQCPACFRVRQPGSEHADYCWLAAKIREAKES